MKLLDLWFYHYLKQCNKEKIARKKKNAALAIRMPLCNCLLLLRFQASILMVRHALDFNLSIEPSGAYQVK